MKGKWLFLSVSIVIFLVIGSYILYKKYNQYIPTPSGQLFLPSALNNSQIQDIRQNTPIQKIKVYKSKRYLNLVDQHQAIIRQYPIRLGFNPLGHKIQEGDGKTPEGSYVIDWRNPNSAFYKSLHISYPNAVDRTHAKSLGVSPGGDIMIHGSATTKQIQALPQLMTYMPRNDWTLGCIAVRNIDIDEIWKLVDNGIRIEIFA